MLNNGLPSPVGEPLETLSALLDPAQQIRRRDPEALRELHDRVEARVAPRALEQADFGSVQADFVAQRLLGEPAASTGFHQIGGELLPRFQRRASSALADNSSTDKNSLFREAAPPAPRRQPVLGPAGPVCDSSWPPSRSIGSARRSSSTVPAERMIPASSET